MTMWIETFFLLDPLYHMKDVMGTHNRIKKTFSLGKNMIEFTEYDRKMCLGTFSRPAWSLAAIYLFTRVRIFGTSVP